MGDAQALEFDDARFDTVVFTLALSTIPDERRALAEAWRVLRPAGRVLTLEHVRSARWTIRLAQRLVDPLLARWTGDHLLRDPLDHLAGLGFVNRGVRAIPVGRDRGDRGAQAGLSGHMSKWPLPVRRYG